MICLDLRTLIGPFSLLKASNTFRSLEQGEELEIWCNDDKSLADLIKVISPDACRLMWMKNLDGKASGLKVRLKKINPS